MAPSHGPRRDTAARLAPNSGHTIAFCTLAHVVYLNPLPLPEMCLRQANTPRSKKSLLRYNGSVHGRKSPQRQKEVRRLPARAQQHAFPHVVGHPCQHHRPPHEPATS